MSVSVCLCVYLSAIISWGVCVACVSGPLPHTSDSRALSTSFPVDLVSAKG